MLSTQSLGPNIVAIRAERTSFAIQIAEALSKVQQGLQAPSDVLTGKGLTYIRGLLTVDYGDGLVVGPDQKLKVNPSDGLAFTIDKKLRVDDGPGITFDVDGKLTIQDGVGLEIDGSGFLKVKTSTGLTADGTGVYIPGGAITNALLATLSVGATNIQSAAVTLGKIASGAVATTNIQNAAITSALIANGAIITALIGTAQITTALIANGAITNALLGTAVIGTANIQNAAITNALINDVSAGKITAGSIIGSDLTLNLNGVTTYVTNGAFGATYAGLKVQNNSTGTKTGIMPIGAVLQNSSNQPLAGFDDTGGVYCYGSNGASLGTWYTRMQGLQGSYSFVEAVGPSHAARLWAYAGTATLEIDGLQVMGPRLAAITPPSGGSTVDAEARTAIGTIISRMQTQGFIA